MNTPYIDWNSISCFGCHEFDDPNHVGSGSNINKQFLDKVIALRALTGWPIVTHAPVGGAVDMDGSWGHAGQSYHRLDMGCKALDFHFITGADKRTQYYYVSKIGFAGIGVYNDWHWDNQLLSIGFHVDDRSIARTQRWSRQDGKYIYFLK